MTTIAAPRIDERLRRFVIGSSGLDTPAAITRATGELAWRLGLPRPSYEQVRVLVRATEPRRIDVGQVARGAVAVVGKTLDFLYQYPGPGLEERYRRYKHGGGL